ncbi:unnamed protein product [Arctogadus glacialis]
MVQRVLTHIPTRILCLLSQSPVDRVMDIEKQEEKLGKLHRLGPLGGPIRRSASRMLLSPPPRTQKHHPQHHPPELGRPVHSLLYTVPDHTSLSSHLLRYTICTVTSPLRWVHLACVRLYGMRRRRVRDGARIHIRGGE